MKNVNWIKDNVDQKVVIKKSEELLCFLAQ